MNDFFSQVYALVSQIPVGKVATYGQIAAMLGYPRGARAVGWAMRAVPRDLKLPAHRVISKSGKLAPSFVFGGEEVQHAALEAEGIKFMPDGRVDVKRHLWEGPAK